MTPTKYEVLSSLVLHTTFMFVLEYILDSFIDVEFHIKTAFWAGLVSYTVSVWLTIITFRGSKKYLGIMKKARRR